MNPNSPNNNANTVGAVRLTNAAGGFTAGVKPIDKKIVPSNPFVKMGYVFLILSVVISTAMYFYDRYLEKSSEQTLIESLSYRDQVKDIPLVDMHDLLNKLTSFNEVASKHTKVTTVFRFMETMTNKNVFWKTMSVRFNEKGSMEISLTGSANSYAALIQQIDELKEPKYREFISIPILGGVNKTEDKVNGKTEVSFGIRFSFLIPFEDSRSGAIFDKLLYGYKNDTNSKLNASTSVILISPLATTSIPTTSIPITSVYNVATSTKSLKASSTTILGASIATNTELVNKVKKNINNLIKNVP